MWHEFNIKIIDKKLEELGVGNMSDSKITIRLDTISRYYHSYDDDENNCTMIMFIDGDSAEVREDYEQVKQIMSVYESTT